MSNANMMLRIKGIYNNILQNLENSESLSGIKITNSQVSAIISSGDTLNFADARYFDGILKTEFLHFVEDKFIFSCYDCDEKEIYKQGEDDDILFLRDICSQLQEYICSCTGNEILITENELAVFLDIPDISVDQLKNINSIFNEDGVIIFNDRPYISYTFPVELV